LSVDKALVPVDERTVDFYGDTLTAVRTDNGQIYVSIRHMCDALGLNVQPQTRRINRHAILADGFMVAILATIKGDRPANWLRVDLVPLWLSGVSTNAVKEEIRPKLERFQREAAKVLWEAFQEGQLTADPVFDELLQQDTPEVQAYKMIQGMLYLARSQIMMRAQIADHETRLEAIEAQMSAPAHSVSQDQAMQISQAVKAVAFAMGGHKKHFQGVYGELYRKYEITSYKLLPAAKFEQVMTWLTEWHQQLTGEGLF
jgi:hypothetical protein